ncbi:hypothetical protein [Enterococcus phage vB_Efa_VP15]|nr:hypothetical protein [Enterococcus phage vB_Efa_VP15]
MIKREAHLFDTQVALQEHLYQMEDNETLSQYTVYDGIHYIITERQMTDDEAKQFKLKQLKKQIKECNERWERRINKCEQLIHEHNVTLNHEVAKLYMQRREDAVEAYNEEQRKLANKLDKLVKLDYTGFIR